jgi:gamma-glutamyltranspeptidase
MEKKSFNNSTCESNYTFVFTHSYREIFINPNTNRTWKEGDVYKRENLANTLERIGSNGVEEFYIGDTAKMLIDELEQQNSILTLRDLQTYR